MNLLLLVGLIQRQGQFCQQNSLLHILIALCMLLGFMIATVINFVIPEIWSDSFVSGLLKVSRNSGILSLNSTPQPLDANLTPILQPFLQASTEYKMPSSSSSLGARASLIRKRVCDVLESKSELHKGELYPPARTSIPYRPLPLQRFQPSQLVLAHRLVTTSQLSTYIAKNLLCNLLKRLHIDENPAFLPRLDAENSAFLFGVPALKKFMTCKQMLDLEYLDDLLSLKFYRFSDLPTELRVMIWQLSFQG